MMTDSEIIDFLDQYMLRITHDRSSCSVDMNGTRVSIHVENPYEGPFEIKVRGRNIRHALQVISKELENYR